MWLPAAGGVVFASVAVWSGPMTRTGTGVVQLSVWNIVLIGATVTCALLQRVYADAFDAYQLAEEFYLPGSGGPFDALDDGRLVAIVNDEVYVESSAGSRAFELHGSLPSADISPFGAAFVRVSPDGTRIAVGNNGGSSASPLYQVGVFDVASLTGDWYAAPHFDAEWIDDRYLAVTAASEGGTSIVTALDIQSADPASPTNPVIINNIGGASGGITFDQLGNLYTGNGYSLAGSSGTGATKAFEYSTWTEPLSGGPAPDFELEGTLIIDILSASPLALDADGDLIVGGGDFYGSGEGDFVAVVNALIVNRALAGMGPADPADPTQVRRLDPDTTSEVNFYSVYYNNAKRELYVKDFGSSRVYVYVDFHAIPAVSTWGLAALSLLLMTAGTLAARWVHRQDRSSASTSRFRATPPTRARRTMPNGAVRAIGIAVVWFGLTPAVSNADPFAVAVIEYQPAPGQFVNNATFNDAHQALGPPVGAGTAVANNESVVTLGGFGGSITLAFAHTVMDDALNPFGMDAIVFGNAFWVGGDPNAHWAECGVIEICRDLNGNGRPDADERWYLIPGSHIDDPLSQWDEQIWDDNVTDNTYPPPFASWIPLADVGTWATETYTLPDEVFGQSSVIRNPNDDQSAEGIFGYADYSPTLVLGDLNADNIMDDPTVTAEEFYTIPDDPLTTGVTEGSGGGDPFDIAWAVDPRTNELAELGGFDFIRITTAVNAIDEGHILNEKSVELDAVADVAPDPFGDYDDDGDIDLHDIAGVQICFDGGYFSGADCTRVDRQSDGWVDDTDVAAFVARVTGPY